jgi:outer membrane biosynthesis protein TonB
MRALLVAMLMVSCGAREVADAIKEAKATPTPEATVTPTEQPRIPREFPESTEVSTEEVTMPKPTPIPTPEATPTTTPTPAPEQKIIVVVQTAPVGRTAAEIEAARKAQYAACFKEQYPLCLPIAVDGEHARRMAKDTCSIWLQAPESKLFP